MCEAMITSLYYISVVTSLTPLKPFANKALKIARHPLGDGD